MFTFLTPTVYYELLTVYYRNVILAFRMLYYTLLLMCPLLDVSQMSICVQGVYDTYQPGQVYMREYTCVCVSPYWHI